MPEEWAGPQPATPQGRVHAPKRRLSVTQEPRLHWGAQSTCYWNPLKTKSKEGQTAGEPHTTEDMLSTWVHTQDRHTDPL